MITDRLLMLGTIAVLIIVIILQRGCISKLAEKGQVKNITGDTSKHVIKKDSAQLQGNVVKLYYPKFTHGKDSIAQDTFFVPAKKLTKADSMQIVKNYLVTRLYRDSICEADMELGILDSIGQNLLLGRTYGIKNLRKTANLITNPTRNKFFVGINLGLSTDLSHYVAGPQISFLTKSDQLYNLGFTFPEKVLSFGMNWKIKIAK